MKARVIGFGLALCLVSGASLGQEAACIESHRAAQKLRKQQKLVEARAELVTCAGAKCPGMIQTDCAQWLAELGREIPSVIISAKDEGGHELTDVSVSVDGKIVAERLDGKPVELDPGAYRFRYERKGSEPIENQVVLQTGVSNRVVEVVFPGGKPDKKRGKTPLASWVLVGVGSAALVSFTYFGLKGRSEYQERDADCAPGCSSDETGPIRTKFLIADVSLVVALAAFSGAGYFYLTRPYETAPASAKRSPPSLHLGATSRAGFATLSGSF